MADQLANVTSLLKAVYGQLQHAVPEKTTLLNWVTKKIDKNWNLKGLYFEEPVNLSRSKGIGFNASNLLPESGQQGYGTRRVYAKTGYTKVKFDRKMIERTKDAPSVAAFGNVYKEEFKGIVRDAANRLNMMLYGDGTGIVATVNGNQAAGQTVIELNPYLGGQDTLDVGACRYLEVGDQVAFLNSLAPATVRCVKTVTAVDYAAQTITVAVLGGPEALTDGDFVVFGQSNFTEYGAQVEGLDACFATADGDTYQNISPGTFARWQAKILDNGGSIRPLNFRLFNRALDWPLNVAKSDPSNIVIIAHTSIKEEYIDLCDGDIRYTNLDLVLKRGARKVMYTHGDNDVPFDFDRQCPYSAFYVLDTDTWEWDLLSDWHEVSLDGSVLKWAGDGKDEYFAYSAIDANLSCKMPNNNVLVTDIRVSPESLQY